MMPMGQNASLVRGDPDRPTLSIRDQFTLSFLWFALNIQNAALLPIVVPTQILLFVSPGAAGNAQQAIFLGWLSALGAVISLVVQPLIGAASDHTTGRWGRRHPYIAGGMVVLVAGTLAMGLIPDLLAFIFGFLLVNLGSNVVNAAYQSLLPDRVPPEQRGAASGFMGLMTILGNVGSLGAAAFLLGQVGSGASMAGEIISGAGRFYVIAAVALVIGLLVTLVGVRERPSQPTLDAVDQPRPAGLRARILAMWLGPWHYHNFTWVFLTRCFVILGLTMFMTFIEYYFANVMHTTTFVRDTAVLAVLALLSAVASALVVGMLSDRSSRVVVVSIATGCMALAALVFVVAPTSFPLWPLGLIFGFGFGAYTSVDWALAVDALPALRAAGKDMGIWNIASTLPAVLAPLVGSVVIAGADAAGQTALGYRAVFALAGICLLAGAVFVFQIREERGGQHDAIGETARA
jgi:MFS family permease